MHAELGINQICLTSHCETDYATISGRDPNIQWALDGEIMGVPTIRWTRSDEMKGLRVRTDSVRRT